jgi:hypothetical protein
MSVAGAPAPSRIGDVQGTNFASSWSGDGKSIVGVRGVRDSRPAGNDLWLQSLPVVASERLAFDTAGSETEGKVSRFLVALAMTRSTLIDEHAVLARRGT